MTTITGEPPMAPSPPAPRGTNWALEKTGFPKALAALRGAPDPGRIAIIDNGNGALSNGAFAKNDIEYVGPADLASAGLAAPKSESAGSHAAEVAGVIALACPEAELTVFNVAPRSGVDRELFLNALDAVRKDGRYCVVNVSLGWLDRDPRVDQAILDTVNDGIVVVAAMGELEEPSDFVSYPAACKGVIAVGATDRFDLRVPGSSIGEHIWLGAPGEDIPTVVTDSNIGLRSGTSFAAALVSAAAWLALRTLAVSAHRGRSADATRVETVRKLLGKSADTGRVTTPPPRTLQAVPPNGLWNMAVGCGRLDVAELVRLQAPTSA